MKKLFKLLLTLCFVTFLTIDVVNANSQFSITSPLDLMIFTNGNSGSDAILKNDIIISKREFNVLSPLKDKNIDMNGFSLIIEKDHMFAVKSKYTNSIVRFYTNSSDPIFIVRGGLELYSGEYSSTGKGSLVKIEGEGKLYTKQPFLESTFYPNDEGQEIGMHSIYDNQKVKMTIPEGTAIQGGSETAYYHMDIHAKTVVDSLIKPVFYYSSIQSSQAIGVTQGTYNGVTNMKKIPIWEHQLVMGIGDDIIDEYDMNKATPEHIMTKDNQYITVSFDTSLFNPLLDEQILKGTYHNVDPFYIDYLPKLELKILKNQEVPLSHFTTFFGGIDCLTEVFYSKWLSVYPIINHINFTNEDNIILEYAYNQDFLSSRFNNNIFDSGVWSSTDINSSAMGLLKDERIYARLIIKEGLQNGYSNVLSLSSKGVQYISEPESEWMTQEKEEVVIPSPPIDGGSNRIPEEVKPEGNDHRNDGSVDEPAKKNEDTIDKDDMDSHIKADEDIVVDLEKNKVVIPKEVVKKYRESSLKVSETQEDVQVEVTNKDGHTERIKEPDIEVIKNETESFSYIGYIGVGIACVICIILFLRHQRRVN